VILCQIFSDSEQRCVVIESPSNPSEGTTSWSGRSRRPGGGRGSLGSLARGWLEGFRIHYNFVREHMGLGRTPAEAAGLDLPLLRNRWLGLIWLAV